MISYVLGKSLFCILATEPFSPGGGESIMNKYETIFVINSQFDEEKINGLVEKFKNLIETSAQLENIDEWGKRRLAYPVDDINEGYYTLVNFSAEPTFPQELERIYKITEGILKYLIIRKDK